MSHTKADKAVVDAGLKAQSVDCGLSVNFGRDVVKDIKCSDEHVRPGTHLACMGTDTTASKR